ncbi:FAD-dependent oxidoreductase [Arthrobacter sp. 1088]|uniref:FAD-dependent oxidoreductase n=1 Tax=Arthrobacter sp. 1088 TaxID=2817768 RepID=UPI00286AB951|nr:FAD-dependent oxidoreductase [Arthrobacter sp. 1088]
MDPVRWLLAPAVGQIHWAGAQTTTVWSGYMDGAARSGRRAADEILEKLSQPALSSARTGRGLFLPPRVKSSARMGY